jgi:hypothetical protein
MHFDAAPDPAPARKMTRFFVASAQYEFTPLILVIVTITTPVEPL